MYIGKEVEVFDKYYVTLVLPDWLIREVRELQEKVVPSWLCPVEPPHITLIAPRSISIVPDPGFLHSIRSVSNDHAAFQVRVSRVPMVFPHGAVYHQASSEGFKSLHNELLQVFGQSKSILYEGAYYNPHMTISKPTTYQRCEEMCLSARELSMGKPWEFRATEFCLWKKAAREDSYKEYLTLGFGK